MQLMEHERPVVMGMVITHVILPIIMSFKWMVLWLRPTIWLWIQFIIQPGDRNTLNNLVNYLKSLIRSRNCKCQYRVRSLEQGISRILLWVSTKQNCWGTSQSFQKDWRKQSIGIGRTFVSELIVYLCMLVNCLIWFKISFNFMN
jgi:hypothetical protein